MAGTPVVISRGTTPWDDVNQNGGFAVELDNPDGFTQALQFLCDADSNGYTEICFKLKQYREEKLNSDELCLKYKEMFNLAISSNKDKR